MMVAECTSSRAALLLFAGNVGKWYSGPVEIFTWRYINQRISGRRGFSVNSVYCFPLAIIDAWCASSAKRFEVSGISAPYNISRYFDWMTKEVY